MISDRVQSAPDTTHIAEAFDDAKLYEAVARRVHNGEYYYDAAALELTARGYPTASIFNWRTPAYTWIFGSPAGIGWGRALLIATALISSAAAGIQADRGAGRLTGIAMTAAFVGSLAWVFYREPAFYMELWSGLLIFWSCSSFGSNRPGWGLFFAAAALVLRELAAPFVVVATAEALWRKRWGRAGALSLILAAFLAAYPVHYQCVVLRGHLTNSPSFQPWISFGGGAFVLAASRMNYLLAMLPNWCAAFFLPLSLLGLLSPRGDNASLQRTVSMAYLLLFLFVGRDFNFYWGLMITPLLLLGFFQSPQALRDLLATALR